MNVEAIRKCNYINSRLISSQTMAVPITLVASLLHKINTLLSQTHIVYARVCILHIKDVPYVIDNSCHSNFVHLMW